MSDQDAGELVRQLALLHRGEALSRLAELSYSADPVVRRKARQLLRQVATNLRDDGQDISRWITAPAGDRPN